MDNNNNSAADAVVYPKPTSDGFFFSDDTNEAMGIESQVYDNGKEVRRVTLSDKRIAIVRQLTGKEMGADVPRLAGKSQEDVQFAMVAIATKIDDKGLPIEEVKEMLGKDYVKLQSANSQINF